MSRRRAVTTSGRTTTCSGTCSSTFNWALEQRTETALAEVGVFTRELRVIAGGEARSQQAVAELLEIDRTSMVGFVDVPERRGLVARRPSDRDRRRNVVELTGDGGVLFREAEKLSIHAEEAFVSSLDEAGPVAHRDALRAMLSRARPGGSGRGR